MSVPRQFRLERVLRLREQREKDLQGQLAIVHRKELEQQTLLGRMHDNRATQLEMITANLTSERVETTYIQFGYAYLDRLQSLIDRQSNVVKQATKATNLKRTEVQQAMQARKAIEKLRDRWQGELFEDDRQRDIKTIDEISTVQFNLRRMEAHV